MPKKKVIAKKNNKRVIKKKTVPEKKTKSKKKYNKSSVQSNPLELFFKENENQLISLISKEFDKELASKAKTYIKSYSKIEDSIITVNDFLNYLKLIHHLQTQKHLYQMKTQKRKKNLLE